jgi:hypothetical protein
MSVVSHLLIDTVTLRRLQEQSQGHGRFTNVFVSLSTTLPFRIAPASASEQRLAEQMKTKCTHAGYCETDVNIHRDDEVVRNGVVYRVVARLPPSKDYFLKVLLEEIQKASA